jgi:DNA-binding NarL/FixJ family response regulator
MATSGNPVRILVVDDNDLVRRGLCSLLCKRPGWSICGEATGGMDAIEKSAQLKPDVILLDLSMPDMKGFEAAKRIHDRVPGSAIVIVTELDAGILSYVEPRPGVRAYVSKSRLSFDLLPAVEAAIAPRSVSVSA